MASRNSESSEMAGAIGLVVMFVAFAAIAILAVGAFVALIVTVLCLFAWKRPLRFGKRVLTPSQARAFVYGGMIGAAAVPGFVAFMGMFLDVSKFWQYWHYMMIFGYTMGAFIAVDDDDEIEIQSVNFPEPQQQIAPPPASPSRPFTFASWEDEEGRK